MPAAILDLNGDRIIEQGSYWSIDVLYPGDVTGSYLRSEVRKELGGEKIAELRMFPPEFESDTNQTRFTLFLNAGTTAKLPIPPAGEFWVYDMLLYLPGQDARRLLQGRVFISPGVTGV